MTGTGTAKESCNSTLHELDLLKEKKYATKTFMQTTGKNLKQLKTETVTLRTHKTLAYQVTQQNGYRSLVCRSWHSVFCIETGIQVGVCAFFFSQVMPRSPSPRRVLLSGLMSASSYIGLSALSDIQRYLCSIMGHDKIMHWLNNTLNIATIEQRRLYNQKVKRNKHFFLHKVGLGRKKLCSYLSEEAS